MMHPASIIREANGEPASTGRKQKPYLVVGYNFWKLWIWVVREAKSH